MLLVRVFCACRSSGFGLNGAAKSQNSPEYQDKANSRGKKETKAIVFHKVDTEKVSDRYVAPCFVSRLEAYDYEINLGMEENMISNKFAVNICLEHENGIVIIYLELDPFLDSSGEEENIGDDWDLLLDDLDFGDVPVIEGIDFSQFMYEARWRNKKDEEEAIIKIKGEALKEKEDPGAFVISIRLEGKINLNALADTGSNINVMPYRVYKELGREEVQNVKKGITMLNHSKAEPMGLLKDVLYQVGVTTIIEKFIILDMPINKDTSILVGRGILYTYDNMLNTIEKITSTFARICHQTFLAAKISLDITKSNSDDEEEYAIQRNKFRASIYGPKPTEYLNCHDLLDRSLALQELLNPFIKIYVWKKVVSFLGSLHVALQYVDWKPYYTGFLTEKRLVMVSGMQRTY
nr:hypothetical protein [Tanacetum cinerariifolium]